MNDEDLKEEVIQEATEEVAEGSQETTQDNIQEELEEVKHVPLRVLQKERRKRQELEARLAVIEEQQRNMQNATSDEEDEYETLTKKEYKDREKELLRRLEEKQRLKEENSWITRNPDKAEVIDEKLEEFLKNRPNFVSVVQNASNRYEQAWELLEKFTPQKNVTKAKPVKNIPKAVNKVSKISAMNTNVDLMSMTDDEYFAWRRAQQKRRR